VKATEAFFACCGCVLRLLWLSVKSSARCSLAFLVPCKIRLSALGTCTGQFIAAVLRSADTAIVRSADAL